MGNYEFLCEFDQFQPVDVYANAYPQNLIDSDSVLQEYQLLEQTQNAIAPQPLSSNIQDLPSNDEAQFFEYIMNSSVPDNALDHLMSEPMVASTIPVVNQTPINPVSATADPLLNIIFDTPTTVSMEASSPAAIVSVPSSYTEPSKTATEVDNKERCKQYRQRIKNKNKSDEAEYEVLKIRNIELKSKAANMEEQSRKMKKMVVAAIRQE